MLKDDARPQIHCKNKMGPRRLGMLGRRVPGNGTKAIATGDVMGVAEGKEPFGGLVKYLVDSLAAFRMRGLVLSALENCSAELYFTDSMANADLGRFHPRFDSSADCVSPQAELFVCFSQRIS